MHTLKITPISEVIGIAAANLPLLKEAVVGAEALNAHPDLEAKWQQFQADGGGWLQFVGVLSPEEKSRLTTPAPAATNPNPGGVQNPQDVAPNYEQVGQAGPVTPPAQNPQDVAANYAPGGGGGAAPQQQDMMGQMQQLVAQRDQINQQIQQIQQMFGFSNPQGGAPAQQAPQGMPGMSQPGQMPGSNPGVIDRVRNWWNERELGKEQNRGYRQNLQQQRQNLQNQRMPQAAKSERPLLTAAMGSASALLS